MNLKIKYLKAKCVPLLVSIHLFLLKIFKKYSGKVGITICERDVDEWLKLFSFLKCYSSKGCFEEPQRQKVCIKVK